MKPYIGQKLYFRYKGLKAVSSVVTDAVFDNGDFVVVYHGKRYKLPSDAFGSRLFPSEHEAELGVLDGYEPSCVDCRYRINDKCTQVRNEPCSDFLLGRHSYSAWYN